MTTYIYALLGLTALCVFWALFQLWLNKADPESAKRSDKCGGCEERCER